MTSLLDAPPGRRTRPLAFAFVWFLLAAPLSLLASAWQQARGWPDPDVLELVMLAPALAAGVTGLLLRGWLPPAPRAIGSAVFARQAATALGWVGLFYLILAILTGDAGALPGTVGGVPIVVMLGLQVLGALGEEIGYRGVLLGAMLSRWSAPVAAVANGLVFGLIHIGYWSRGPISVGLFVLGTIALTVGMTALYRGSLTQRVATTVVMHSGVNAVLFAVGDGLSMWRFALATWAATTLVLIVRRWNLARFAVGNP